MTTADTIIAIVADQAAISVAEVKPEMRLEDLSLDSLDIVEMVMDIEDRLGLDMDTNDAEFTKIATVEGLIDYTEKRLKEEKA
jgi:acyl carrier protein